MASSAGPVIGKPMRLKSKRKWRPHEAKKESRKQIAKLGDKSIVVASQLDKRAISRFRFLSSWK